MKKMEQELNKRNLHCLIHQIRYSMLDRENLSIIDAVNKSAIGTIAFCPLAQGLLTDKYLKGIPMNSRAASGSPFLSKSSITEKKLEMVKRLNDIAAKRGQTLAQMALSWNLSTTTSVILGASRLEQIYENVQALDHMDFTESEFRQIEEILN